MRKNYMILYNTAFTSLEPSFPTKLKEALFLSISPTLMSSGLEEEFQIFHIPPPLKLGISNYFAKIISKKYKFTFLR